MKTLLSLLTFLTLCTSTLQAQSSGGNNEYLLELLQSQNYKEAAEYLERTSDPKDQKSISRLAYCYMMAGNLPEAEKRYKHLQELDSTNTNVLYNLAVINEKRGNYQLTKTYYQKITEQDSTNFFVYKRLSFIAEQLKDNALQLSALMRANYLSPSDPDVAYDLSRTLRANEQLEKADSVIDVALAADSLNLLLTREKMKIAHWMKKRELARDVAKRAVALLGDKSGETISILAQSYYHLNQFKDCINTYNLLEQEKLGNEISFYYTALAYSKLKDYNNSIEYLHKSIDDGISDNISLYYQQRRRTSKSWKNIQKQFRCTKRQQSTRRITVIITVLPACTMAR
ncbi:lipopolysaccharide assembly protein LapB [Pedobacter sp. SYSU D00535]|uniref:tetratricopeptide repeat protein n=1 Tax=Pedobacter sp. SYSU D00535 TaxID=2810308 RepID=UPI001A958A55|nr:tetratricopeptide repeat protein [Pedobacter sp. SYSU D00535]